MVSTLIEIITELGSIQCTLYDDCAPVTVSNFLRYVDGGFFAGGSFWRTVRLDNQPEVAIPIEVIQGAINPEREADQFAAIPLERTSQTGLRHLDGTLSMSRREPDSAQSGFFICVNDQPQLDFGGARYPDGQGFAAFGRVVQGMEVVRRIHISPCSVTGGEPTPAYAQMEFQKLTPAISIANISRV